MGRANNKRHRGLRRLKHLGLFDLVQKTWEAMYDDDSAFSIPNR